MKLWTCVLVVCAAVCVACGQQPASDEDWLELDTPQGPVRGRKDPEFDLYAFYNLPYATAPLNEDKFKPPLPAPVWTTPFDAIDQRVICPQTEPYHISLLPSDAKTLDDCLIANVFVPDTAKKNLPVLVYVHGGGFFLGYGEFFKSKHFLDTKDMIVVTFNYRLGVHGFLCLGTEDAPGNAGMKDQVALLRWVNKNIASYGGKPDDVTIAGYSAGSASVDLLMLSKSAEGLFHKVIPESGGNLGAFTIQRNPLETAKDMAKKFKFTNVDDINALEKFYKTASWELLHSDEDFPIRPDSSIAFTPCIEPKTENEAFLTETPLSILQKGNYKKLPVLYGFTNMEGLMEVPFFPIYKDRMNVNFSEFLPVDLAFDSEEEKKEVAEKVKQFYFRDKPVSEDNILGFVDFFTDVMFTHSILWAVKLQVEAGHDQIYLYEYSFVDEDTPLVPYTDVRGADHIDQTRAVMDGRNMTYTDESTLTPAFKNMKKIAREIWRNFIKTGKPIPEGSSLPSWPATGATGAPYMSLGQTVELRDEPLLEKRTRFWQDIYQKYYREPIPPPAPTPKSCTEL